MTAATATVCRPFAAPVWWAWLLAGAGVGALMGNLTAGDPPEMPAAVLIAMLFWGVLVYPPLEELAFRGLIQGGLRRCTAIRCGPLTLANLLTSLLFALTHHLVWQQPAAWWVVVPSLLFGWSRDVHQTLAGAIVLHMVWNCAFILGRA